MRLTHAHRIALLLALLAAECVGVAALRSLGWVKTGSLVSWLACLALALVPLVIAAALIFRRRMRFSLRALLAIMTLVAIFLVITGIPLRKAIAARQMNRRLLDAGAHLRYETPSESFLVSLGYPPPRGERRTPGRDLPPWLRPLAGEVIEIAPHDAVRSIDFENDQQIAAFCSDPAAFINLTAVGVFGNVTPHGVQQLVNALSRVPTVVHFSASGVFVPAECLRSLTRLEYLRLEGPQPVPNPLPGTAAPQSPLLLVEEHFAAIASLPNLKVLVVMRQAVADPDFAPLAKSTSLEHIFFRRILSPMLGFKDLQRQLPTCDIRRD